jgi:hypothetical protein
VSEQEIKIEISLACGWLNIDGWYVRPDQLEAFRAGRPISPMPDFWRDMNAMQIAVEYQGQGFNDKFAIRLEELAKSKGKHIHQLLACDWAKEFVALLEKKGTA